MNPSGEVVAIAEPYLLASRKVKQENTIVRVGNVEFGGGDLIIIAGPLIVESREQIFETATAVCGGGANLLLAGAFKSPASPYEFHGLGFERLKLLKAAGEATGLPVVTEVLSTTGIDMICDYADMVQVGSQNMQNFALLRGLAQVSKPILLQRGASATINEWLLAAEYLLMGGNSNVVLSECGVRAFDPEMPNTLDLGSVVRVKELSHLPVIVNPSQATGRSSVVPAAARAATAVGADGVMIEVDPQPGPNSSRSPQALTIAEFALLTQHLHLYRAEIAYSIPMTGLRPNPSPLIT